MQEVNRIEKADFALSEIKLVIWDKNEVESLINFNLH